jgi:hypothetical protein
MNLLNQVIAVSASFYNAPETRGGEISVCPEAASTSGSKVWGRTFAPISPVRPPLILGRTLISI